MAYDGKGMPVGQKVSFGNERFPLKLFSPSRCLANHHQTPERLAERGGLSWVEAANIILNRKWEPMGIDEATRIVVEARDAL